MGKPIGSVMDLRQAATPSAPAAGLTSLYSKSDSGIYLRSSTLAEQKLLDTNDVLGGGNLLLNSSGESYDATAGFANWPRNVGSGTLTATPQTGAGLFVPPGLQSIQLVSNTTGADNFVSQTVTVIPGFTYCISGWRYVPTNPTGGANGNRSLYVRDSAGVKVALTTDLTTGVATGVWVRQWVSITPDGTQLTVRLYAPNGTVYWDNIQLEFGRVPSSYAPMPLIPSLLNTSADNTKLQSAAGANVPLTITGASGGQTGHLQDWQTGGGSPATVAFVDSAGNNSSPTNILNSELTSTNPSTPSAGVTLFARRRARATLAYVGPSGQDSRLQDALYSNSYSLVEAINASNTFSVVGTAVTVLNAGGTSPTSQTVSTTSFYNGRKRFRVSSTAVAGTAGEVRSNASDVYLSSTANDGGFHFVCRFGLGTAAANNRGFIGLNNSISAYPAGSNPGAGLNQIGFYWDPGMTTIHFITAGTVVGTSVDLGANFPCSSGGGINFYEVALFAPSGAGQQVYYSITRLNDGAYAGVSTPVTGTTTLPAIGAVLAWHLFYGNGANAAAVSLDVQSVYLTSDN